MSRTVSIKLIADVAGYMSGLGRAAVATKDFNGELNKAASGGKVEQITKAVGFLGVGLVGIAAGAVKMRMDFDKSMSAAQAATQATGTQLKSLSDAAIQAGKDTQFSATQAADGITELGKAGVSTADILNGGLTGALDLAAAGQESVGDAAETAASAMTQFKLTGSQLPHVADLLAAAAGKAQGSVHDVSEALNQSGLVASQFGLSVEDTTGALAEFANAGLIGSDAGTSFKTMLLAIATPSSQSRDLMQQLGISFYDTQGKFIGLAGVAQVLQDKLKGLTDEQKQQALGQIFGSDAIRTATVLYKDGAKGVDEWKGKVNDSGYAARNAAALTDNLSGDLERLKGSLETVAIQAGGGATNGLRSLTKGVNGLVNAFADLPAGLQSGITIFSGLGGGALLAAAGFLKARGTINDFLTELKEMGPRGETAANVLSKIGGVAGKLTLAGTAAVGLYEGMKLFGDWVDHFSAPTARDVDKMTTSLQEFATTGKLTGELAKTFGANMSGLAADLNAIQKSQAALANIQNLSNGPAGQQGADRAMAAMGDQIKHMRAQADTDIAALDQSLANLASNGNLTAAKLAFSDFAHSQGITLSQLPKYAAAAKSAALANSGLAKGFGTAADNAKTLTSSLDEAVAAGQTLTDVWNQLHGAIYSMDKADLQAKQSIDDLKKALKDNKDALTGNSEAALKDRIAVAGAAQAAAAAAQAKYEETGSVKDANKVYNTYITQLKKTLSQAGVTKGEIDKLTAAYLKMPPSVATTITAPGATKAKDEIDEAHDAAKRLAGIYNAAITVTGQGKAEAEFHKLSLAQQALKSGKTIEGFALGGWTGPGGKYEPAGVVHADEFVIQKSSRQAIEKKAPGLLDHMNVTGSVPGYAGGGIVMPYPTTVAGTKVGTLASLFGSTNAGGGSLGAWIMSAIALAGVPANWAGPLRTLVMRESGGHPNAVNLWDSNAKAGHPSAGLAQTIPSTFEHYRLKSLPDDIFNPVANLVAAIRYILSRYGSISHVQQANANLPPKGYAKGGAITEPIHGVGASGRHYTFGEVGPEWVTPGGRPQMQSHSARAVNINVSFSGPVGSQYELKQWLTGTLDDLKRAGRF